MSSRTRYLTSVFAVALTMNSCSLFRSKNKAKYLAEGNRYYSLGMYTQARSMYVKAIQADRMFGEAHYRAGLTAIQLHNWGESIQYLLRAIDLQPANEDAYARLGSVYCLAYTAAQSTRHPLLMELKSLSTRLHERFPGRYDDERIGAYVALFSNDPAAAVERFERANQIRPYEEDIVLPWLETLLRMGRVGQARDLADRALTANPRMLRVYDLLLAEHLRTGDTKEVERIARLKVQNNPSVASGFMELAAHCFAAGNLIEMGSVLRTLTERPADFPGGALLLGDFYVRIRDWHAAEEQYRRGLSMGDKTKAGYQKRLVEVLVRQRRQDEAVQLIQDVIAKDAGDVEAIAIRGSLPVIAGDTDRFPAALEDFKAVAGKLPEDFVLRYLHGRALLLSGDGFSAVIQFKAALELRPDYLWPRISLAFITLEGGDQASALFLSRSIVADQGANVPFETAGQRPQERPLYGEILHVRPDSHVVLKRLAEALVAKHVAPVESLALSRLAREQER